MKKGVITVVGAAIVLTSCSLDGLNRETATYQEYLDRMPLVFELEMERQARQAGWHKTSGREKEVRIQSASEKSEAPVRPRIPSVKLPEEVLDVIWKETSKKNIDYMTFLALIKVESNFNAELVHSNPNGTEDYGLVQMNSVNVSRLSKAIGRPNLDMFEPKDNILLGLAELLECRAYWQDDYKGDDLEKAMLLAYNRGRYGSKRWIQDKGTLDSAYTKRVLNTKALYKREAAKAAKAAPQKPGVKTASPKLQKPAQTMRIQRARQAN
ncbi:transglycosylase SLT domain-containing protein [Paenibacillus dendritiformis]|uniref:transglycosylase SLT domain-containing protein n=1 Tax=Paenibacillus dendritiformis TaxID=130049 RepID=UPI00143D0547|nr:transglycosylase SLT domain-containing protein [Paenibacillus dendritiformis]NKI19850.1 transglycosylase SLT domain-containing protein [Paenibacillus dendritiformis]NRF99968.1 transglycosylase SLT domain-containing protein [Paenibacillus dendritiformis]